MERVDEYIVNAAPFAKPVLLHLIEIIHETCPEAQEDIKWGNPHFSYKGDYMIILSAYTKHCSFSLFKAELMENPMIKQSVMDGKKFGPFDKLTSVEGLPDRDVLVSLIKEAMSINEKGLKKPDTRPKVDKPATIETPDYFQKALEENQRAKEVFETRSPSFRKEYVVWVSSAKTDTTRNARVSEAISWIAEGKGRFWQYKK